MSWLNPWAWLGLTALAVPVAVHLLARRQARPLPFPTLRFLGAPRTVLARRDRLNDVALFVVRAGIVALAVAALAQPHVLTNQRRQARNATIARAIVVDASASMARPASSGGTALDTARRSAQQLAAEAQASSIRESTNVAGELAGQTAWLGTQSGRHELVVISDFQPSAISASDIAAVPAGTGVRLMRVAVTPDSRPLEFTSSAGGTETTTRMTLAASQTSVEWTWRRQAPAAAVEEPLLLAGDLERPKAEAAREAARALATSPPRTDRPVAIVFPGFPGRALLNKEAGPLTEPWMFDVVAQLRKYVALGTYVGRTKLRSAEPALVVAASGRVEGRNRLLLFCSADAGSLISATLMAGVERAQSPVASPEELDPSTIPDDTLRRWERAPAATGASPVARDRQDSDGRWFWVGALVLLAIETWMRRQRRSGAQQPAESQHARVA